MDQRQDSNLPRLIVGGAVSYADEGSEDVDAKGKRKWDHATEWKDGLSSPLGRVVDRTRLLGHTKETARKE